MFKWEFIVEHALHFAVNVFVRVVCEHVGKLDHILVRMIEREMRGHFERRNVVEECARLEEAN